MGHDVTIRMEALIDETSVVGWVLARPHLFHSCCWRGDTGLGEDGVDGEGMPGTSGRDMSGDGDLWSHTTGGRAGIVLKRMGQECRLYVSHT